MLEKDISKEMLNRERYIDKDYLVNGIIFQKFYYDVLKLY